MGRIDPNSGWKAVDERLQRTENPRHRAMLGVLIHHMQSEMVGDLDGMMDGLCAEPKYHMWGSGRDTGPKGYDDIKHYYTDLLAARRGVLEYTIDRIVMDDDAIVTEGTIRAYQAGAVATAFGFDVPRTDATYLVTYRALIVWPFDEQGDLIGEDGYGAWDARDFEAIDSDELPEEYKALFAEHEYASVGIRA
jgi:hypothetical protein